MQINFPELKNTHFWVESVPANKKEKNRPTLRDIAVQMENISGKEKL